MVLLAAGAERLSLTPNFVHFDPAIKLVKEGIPVFCEKPLTVTAAQAEELAAAVEEKKVPFGIAHTYIGHWSSWFSRWIITSGVLGAVRWVDAYYLQGWLATKLEDDGQMQASWRTDPQKAGASCCGGDIGTHAFMQTRFVTGLEITSVRGMVETFLQGRQLDDHFTTYCELSNGGRAMIRATQIAIGHRNDLGIEINCDGSRYANVHDGLKHMKFVEAAVASSKNNSLPVAMQPAANPLPPYGVCLLSASLQPSLRQARPQAR